MTPHKQVIKGGDKARYKLTMQIEPGGKAGQKIGLLEKYLVDTTSAAADGSWSQVTKFDLTKVTLAGKELDVLANMPVVTVTRDVKGKYQAATEAGDPEGNTEIAAALQQIAAMPEVLLPRRKVKVGDHWKIEFTNANLMIGAAHLTGEARLAGVEKIGDRNTVKISFQAEGKGSTGSDALRTEGAIYLEEGTGRMVQLTQKGAGRFAGGPANVALEVSLAGE